MKPMGGRTWKYWSASGPVFITFLHGEIEIESVLYGQALEGSEYAVPSFRVCRFSLKNLPNHHKNLNVFTYVTLKWYQ